MGGMPRLAVTASGGTEKCHTAEKPVKVRKECLVPSPPLLAKAGGIFSPPPFCKWAFLLVISTKNKSPLIGRNCHCRPWHGVGVGYNVKKTCSQRRVGRSVALVQGERDGNKPSGLPGNLPGKWSCGQQEQIQ